MESMKLLSEIIDFLATLSRKVEISNSLNLTDINIYAEDFYAQLLNLIFDLNLKNANNQNQNACAIDLYDQENRVAVQVTSNSEVKKYRETVEKFVNNNLHEKYTRLIILILVRKRASHRKDKIEFNGFVFDVNADVIGVSDVAAFIKEKTLGEIQIIYAFLEKYFKSRESKNESIVNNNFNFQGATVVGSNFTLGGNQHVANNALVENALEKAKLLFERKMFLDAEKILCKLSEEQPHNEEVSVYYILSIISDIDISTIKETKIRRLYQLSRGFSGNVFFDIIRLILSYEYDDVHFSSLMEDKERNDLISALSFSISEDRRKLLNNLRLFSRKAPRLLEII